MNPNNFTIPLDLSSYEIGAIRSLLYIPDIISLETEQRILEELQGSVWTPFRTRKLQIVGNPKASTLAPPLFEDIFQNLVDCQIFDQEIKPNQAVVNQYSSTGGIDHHVDGEVNFPKVAILSLDSPLLMTFRKEINGDDIFSVCLQPRSLFVFSQDGYSTILHGIKANNPIDVVDLTCPCMNKELAGVVTGQEIHRGDRISLTIRRLLEGPSAFPQHSPSPTVTTTSSSSSSSSFSPHTPTSTTM